MTFCWSQGGCVVVLIRFAWYLLHVNTVCMHPSYWVFSLSVPCLIWASLFYLFKQIKKVCYNLRSSQIITQPKCNSQTHGYHSLRNEGTRFGATLHCSSKEVKDINTFTLMIVNYINWLLLMCLYWLLFILINVLFCGFIVLLFLVNCALYMYSIIPFFGCRYKSTLSGLMLLFCNPTISYLILSYLILSYLRIHRNVVHWLIVFDISFLTKQGKCLCVYILLPLTNSIMYF